MNMPVDMMMRAIIQRFGGTGEQAAMRIMQQYPAFAQKLQGQNLEQLGRNTLQQIGVDADNFKRTFYR